VDFDSAPASRYPLPDLVKLLNRGFEEYSVPIRFNADMFENMLRKDGIDLADSRILIAEDQPCGIALIACRKAIRTSRLAAMGIAKGARGKGAGSWFMRELIHEACERGDRQMVLEVIEHNEPAVRLYRKYGFESVRRLVGYTRQSRDRETAKNQTDDLKEVDLHEAGTLISRYGLPDLPWQLSGESISLMNPAPRAYRHGEAYVVISNPEAEHVVLWSLLVEPEARGRGLGTQMLKLVIAQHGERKWHVPALCPEEFGRVFEKAGFQKEKLSQWQMKLRL
jgi:ribosomal protein S18 acetylase RimI-like enzyme